MNEGNTNADNEETLEPNGRGADDGGWGRIRPNNGSTRAIKTKGSWAFARRTLSGETTTNLVAGQRSPSTIKVPSLTVLAAEQVAKVISDKEMLQLAPIHTELIRRTGIKRKNEKAEGGASPKEGEKKKKKAGENAGNDITLSENTKSRSNETINKEGNAKNENI